VSASGAERAYDLVDAGPLPRGRAAELGTVWALAWPVILTLSLESLVGLIDMLMVGRLGATAVAAVGVGVHIMSAVATTMFAVGTGTLAIVARHVGAREPRRAEEVLFQSVLAAAVLGAVVAVPVMVWAPAVVRAAGVDESVVDAAARFVRIVMLGLPADAVFFVVALGLRGAGDTRTPLLIGAAVGLVTVVGDWLLIFGHFGLPALGVAGAACATAAGYMVGGTASVVLLARGGLVLRLPVRRRLRLDVVRRVLAIGYPAALEHILMQLGFLLYIVFAARYGTAPVAAYVIGVRILALSFLPGFGFAAAAGTLVGQSLGAGRPGEAARSGWHATGLAVALMSAGGLVVCLAARPIAALFTNDPVVAADAVSFIRVLGLAQPLMAIDFTLGGALRGAGDTRFPLVAVFVGFYVCRLGMAWLVTFVLGLGVLWLWLALVGDYLARALLKGWRFRSGAWQMVRV
jgi:putative MATE family efflux protein